MRILKFGGTSVGSPENIRKVLAVIADYQAKQVPFAVVVSAMSGITNLLIQASKEAEKGEESYLSTLKTIEEKHIQTVSDLITIQYQSEVFAHVKRIMNGLEDFLKGIYLIKELSPKSQDYILSHGERLSAFIINKTAVQQGLKTSFVDARTIIQTDDSYGNAKVDFEKTKVQILEKIDLKDDTPIITGFIASSKEGNITTLGRGGSDYTASILGEAFAVEQVEIWTDVDGVMTADPRMVKNAFSLPAISYKEAMEMTHFGAKVIYPPTLQPLVNSDIPVLIKNTFNPSHIGTKVSEKSEHINKLRVKGISSIQKIALLSIQGSGMVGVTGVSGRLFGSLAQAGINIILITQASSEHSICLAVAPEDAQKSLGVIKEEFFYELEAKKIDQIIVEEELSIVAAIGENMKDTPGISGKMFHSLGKNGVNIRAIAQGSSELNISAVIAQTDLSKALNALHDAFFLSDARSLNLFVLGPGLIGGTLLNQIAAQYDYLVQKLGLAVKVVGLANSRKMIFNQEGIDLSSWKEALDQGKPSSFDTFVQEMKNMNLPNSVFVDNTSNKEIANYYEEILSSSISIVTPNKVANSGSYVAYENLKKASLGAGSQFLYETNVGAGLPVINTLQNLINSGDEILKIEGVLSGSLSFIFNSYDGSSTFKEVVLQAKEKGFTEPDPRDDLNGMDVARKILILARDAGYALEPEDVKIENILPQACLDAADVDAFFVELEKADQLFENKRAEAAAKGKKLCFIACLQDGKISVGLDEVGAEHPFYGLSGSDNMISFTTSRYKTNPLVIKGPGAGAEVTAAGVFADIISISNQ